MALKSKIWNTIWDYTKGENPDMIIEGVENYPQPVQNSIAICYKGGNLLLPNTCVVDTIEIED